MEAQFLQGTPQFADYTPSGSAVAVGEVVVIGNRPYVAHSPITDGQRQGGALARRGGEYLGEAGENSMGNGEEVYFDISANEFIKAASAATGDVHFGHVAPGSSGDDGDTIRIIHEPNGTIAS